MPAFMHVVIEII